MEEPKVCAVMCFCGNPIKLAVFKDGMLSTRTHKEISKLVDKGYGTRMVSLQQAREMELCFKFCTEKRHEDNEND